MRERDWSDFRIKNWKKKSQILRIFQGKINIFEIYYK